MSFSYWDMSNENLKAFASGIEPSPADDDG